LSQKGVEFIDYDVTSERAALEEMRTISGGALRVPVISVCNQVMVGFDQKSLEQALMCLEGSSSLNAD
jgi:glutaredoxin